MSATLFARRAPEATGEFIAVQLSRLDEALLISFGAMSGANLPAVDRVVIEAGASVDHALAN